ncbi:MAG: hypothetical protein HQL33_03695 [Alphaproteobacteria bacterium]|nr:hypothetical protein [Alphaproteobacteria bacterium]MBF0129075.1 hypothetical protein [Alphaproteobacteria bacterium]
MEISYSRGGKSTLVVADAGRKVVCDLMVEVARNCPGCIIAVDEFWFRVGACDKSVPGAAELLRSKGILQDIQFRYSRDTGKTWLFHTRFAQPAECTLAKW